MADPRFDKSVVFICAHSADGAMGLVVNKPTHEISFSDLLAQLDIPAGKSQSNPRLYYGGPVENSRGFVLHSTDYKADDGTLLVNDAFAMSATRSILIDIAEGAGPSNTLPALGYAGWGPAQLEGEMQQNAWLTCEADPEIVFAADSSAKWEAALTSLGISPLMLSAEGGRA